MSENVREKRFGNTHSTYTMKIKPVSICLGKKLSDLEFGNEVKGFEFNPLKLQKEKLLSLDLVGLCGEEGLKEC